MKVKICIMFFSFVTKSFTHYNIVHNSDLRRIIKKAAPKVWFKFVEKYLLSECKTSFAQKHSGISTHHYISILICCHKRLGNLELKQPFIIKKAAMPALQNLLVRLPLDVKCTKIRFIHQI